MGTNQVIVVDNGRNSLCCSLSTWSHATLRPSGFPIHRGLPAARRLTGLRTADYILEGPTV